MIRKRNLDPSLISWIMTTTGLGPGIGDIFFVASASSNYYYWLRDDLGLDPGHLFTDLTVAYNTTTASRNDCILIAPGSYDIDTEIAWSKAFTHLIGFGGPNCTQGDHYEPNVCIYTDSTSVASIVTLTGAYCQFHNVQFWQYGNNAACLTAFTLDKYGAYFKNVGFKGVATAGVDDVAAAASLYITGNGFYPVFEDCVIGQNEWDEREGANSGQLRFVGAAGAPSNGTFRRCRFLSVSNTATCAMVAVPAVDYVGRGWLMDNCFFFNESGTQTNLNQVFYMNTAGSDNIPCFTLNNCAASGFDEWQDGDNASVVATMPIVGLGGGLGREPTAATGT